MSVLIRDIDMPSMCKGCSFCSLGSFGVYLCKCPSKRMYGVDITRFVKENSKHPNCPIEQVNEVMCEIHKSNYSVTQSLRELVEQKEFNEYANRLLERFKLNDRRGI